MNSKTILEIEKPVTQTTQAVCALLAWKGRSSNPLPEYVEMGKGDSRLVLVLSNKRDAYYTTTARDCSCPAHNWHPGQRCKHQRKYFPEQQTITKPAGADLIPRQQFKPFLEDEARPAKAAASPAFELVDTTPDATPGELAYQSIKADREMWPMVVA